jgi:hypothetical protein
MGTVKRTNCDCILLEGTTYGESIEAMVGVAFNSRTTLMAANELSCRSSRSSAVSEASMLVVSGCGDVTHGIERYRGISSRMQDDHS